MKLNEKNQILLRKTKPVITMIGYSTFLLSLGFSMQQDWSFIQGGLFVASIEIGYLILAVGLLAFLLARRENRENI